MPPAAQRGLLRSADRTSVADRLRTYEHTQRALRPIQRLLQDQPDPHAQTSTVG